MRALDAGPIEDIEAKYGAVKQAVGFEYEGKVCPSVVFKPKPEVTAMSP